MPINRNRLLYAGLTAAAVVAGLASRQFFGGSPFVRAYVGDALWALMVFFGIGLLFVRWSTTTVALAALLFSFGIEFSQLYHAPWIDALRHTRLGGLALGFGFVWSDLLSYSAGVVVGVAVERGLKVDRST